MTIKKSAANEILTSMAEQLKVASLARKFRADLKAARTEAEVDAVCRKYNKQALLMEGVDVEAMCNAAKSRIRRKKDAAIELALSKIAEAADIFDKVGLERHADGVDELIKWITKE